MRKRLSFANVTSMLALFIALGGSAYAAAQLPANSVGKSQIRSSAVGKSEAATGSVGRSEVRSSAIGTKEIRDGKIDVADLTPAALAANGVTFRAAVSDAGALTGGNAKSATRTTDPGVYSVDLGTDVSKCQVSATVAGTGATVGFATVAPGASTNLLTVSTFDGTGAAANRPFNLLIAC